LANLTYLRNRSCLFDIAAEKGYFVKNSTGQPYIMKSISIEFVSIDFTNVDARKWYKDTIIKKNVLQEARASGWMADFGEYLAFDAYLQSGIGAASYHNKYPEDWARTNYEAVHEAEKEKETIYFMRSSSIKSPAFTSLYWVGD